MPPDRALILMQTQSDVATCDVAKFGADEFADATGATTRMMQDLETYRGLLEDANRHMNLVGPSALDAFWLRHAYDSAQLLALAPQARIWADVGAGAGFPGLVLAILLRDQPGAAVTLVDSMAKRTRFLAQVVETLSLNTTVITARAEALTPPHGVQVVTARACARLPKLLYYAEPYFAAGAQGLFLKGQDAEREIAEARMYWSFTATLHASKSDPTGRVIQIERLQRG